MTNETVPSNLSILPLSGPSLDRGVGKTFDNNCQAIFYAIKKQSYFKVLL